MILLGFALLAAVAITPLLLSVWRTPAARSGRQAALAIYRAQLVEIDRDLAEGRIDADAHVAARLEIQRRLLAQDAVPEGKADRGDRMLIVAAAIIVPLAGFGLYLRQGHPELLAQPLAARLARAEQEKQSDAALVSRLRAAIATLDPKSDRARDGYVLLGNVLDERGDVSGAVDAWRQALSIRFDPTLAAQTAELMSRIAGHVTSEALALFRRALAEAPRDAPWRGIAEQRVAGATNE